MLVFKSLQCNSKVSYSVKMLDWKKLGFEYALDQLFKGEYLQLPTILSKSPKFFSPNSQYHELCLIYLSEA